MILKQLKIEGLTSIRSAEVDFSTLPSGLIAVAGPVGAGKTTMLESIVAALYRELPSRGKPSVPHSAEIQNWVDPVRGGGVQLSVEHGGHDIQTEVRVSKAGKGEAYLFVDGVKKSSGKVKDFDEQVERHFGSKQALYAANFGVQGGRGRFGDMGEGTRKGLFSYYLGLDRIALCREGVKKRRQLIDVVALNSAADRIVQIAAVYRRVQEDVKRVESDVERVKGVAIAAQAELVQAAQNARNAQEASAQLATLKHDAEAGTTELNRLVGWMQECDRQCPPRDRVHGVLWDVTVLEDLLARTRAWTTKTQVVQTACREAVSQCERAEAVLNRAQEASDLLKAVPCNGAGKYSGCRFLSKSIMEAQRVDALRAEWIAWGEKVEVVLAAESELDTQRPCEWGVDALQAWLSAVQKQALLEDAWKKAGAVAHSAWENYDRASKDAETLVAQLSKLRHREQVAKQADEELEGARVRLASLKSEASRLKQTLKEALEFQEGAEPQLKRHSRLQWLEWALGPDGVPAMEIASAGPKVSAHANELLTRCFGSRFALELTTQRTKSDGDLVEDFDVLVHDQKRPNKKDESITSLSGGERVLAEEALRIGLVLFSQPRLPSPVLTLFRDELTGGLSTEEVDTYMTMLREGARMAGLDKVLWISHDPRVWDMADALIRVVDGEVEVER